MANATEIATTTLKLATMGMEFPKSMGASWPDRTESRARRLATPASRPTAAPPSRTQVMVGRRATRLNAPAARADRTNTVRMLVART